MGYDLDLLQFLECVEVLLCEDDLWWGVSPVIMWMTGVMVWDLEQSLWELWWLWLWYLQGWDCDLDLLCLYLSWWWCLEDDLTQCLVLDSSLWWCMVVPEGGILLGQLTTMWLYSSHSKQCTFGQWHAIWPDSRHWKHLSSSWNKTFIVDEGNKVAINCYSAWHFSTLLMVYVRVCGAFS